MTSLHHVVPAADRAAFLECRRAWDFSARERGDREPVPAEPVDAERAVRAALAVYYFPGMWDWSPAIVLPLVRRAYTESVAAHRTEYLTAHGLANLPRDVAARADERAEQRGRATLEAYLAWAPDRRRVRAPAGPRGARRPGPPPAHARPRPGRRPPPRPLPRQRRPARDGRREQLLDGRAPLRRRAVADVRVRPARRPVPVVVLGVQERDHRGSACAEPCTTNCRWAALRLSRRARGATQHRRPARHHRGLGGRRRRGVRPAHPARRRVPTRAGAAPTEVAAFGQRLAAQLAEMIDAATPVYPNPSTALRGRVPRSTWRSTRGAMSTSCSPRSSAATTSRSPARWGPGPGRQAAGPRRHRHDPRPPHPGPHTPSVRHHRAHDGSGPAAGRHGDDRGDRGAGRPGRRSRHRRTGGPSGPRAGRALSSTGSTASRAAPHPGERHLGSVRASPSGTRPSGRTTSTTVCDCSGSASTPT